MKRIYFDYAASTPMALEVFRAMLPYFNKRFGNPGSLHFFGQEAMAAVDGARQKIARAIGADFREIIFTGSATEANNLALRGVIESARIVSRRTGRRSAPAAPRGLDSRRVRSAGDQAERASETFRSKQSEPFRIIVSSIEHESVLDTARALEREGVEVVYLPVDNAGFVDLTVLKSALDERTILVSIMYANNEIGTIQSIETIGEIIKNFNPKILFHTDAVQAFQFLNCGVDDLGVDFMTLSAHKIYGPKGMGCLYVRGGSKNLTSLITGGGQEFGLRSGTENVASIVGFGEAVELTIKNRTRESKRSGGLKKYFWQELKKIYPRTEINGGRLAGIECRTLPSILNVYFPGHKSDELLIKLDQAGIAVSSGSACSVRSSKPSHVLKALGLPISHIQGSLRFSFGKFTTKKEIEESLIRFKKVLSP